MLKGHARALVVPGFLQPLANPGALWDGFEEAKRHLILRFHPGLRFVAVVVFEPAIRIGHFRAVVVVDDTFVFTGVGVVQRLGKGGGGHEVEQKAGTHER